LSSAFTETPVYKSGSGVVKQAENLGGWGMIVILEHIEGISSRYATWIVMRLKLEIRLLRVRLLDVSGIQVNPQVHTSTMRSERRENPLTRPKIIKKSVNPNSFWLL